MTMAEVKPSVCPLDCPDTCSLSVQVADGNVVGVLGRAGKLPGQFGWIHQMAAPSANTLFIAEVLNWRVQKLTLHS